MALPYSSLANKTMLHEAVGSMPAQPVKDPNAEEIITPVEEVEEELTELSSDTPEEVPEAPLEAPEAAPEEEDGDSATITPEEEEMTPDGEEPVIEPID